MAYVLAYGSIPPNTLVIHSCDAPECCNPRHLRTGSHQDNSDDAVKRERVPRGEDHGRTQLAAEDVAEMRWEHLLEGTTTKELARKYGVPPGTVHDILKGRAWKHAGGPALAEHRRRTALPARVEREIRARRAAGEAQTYLAREYGVSQSTVSRVVSRG